MYWSRLPPPPRRGFGRKIETRRSCGVQLRLASSRRRRSCAAEPPDGNAEPLRLVSEIVLNSRAREMHDADRQKLEQGIVPLERRRFGMLGPIWLAFHRTAEDWIVRMVAGRNGGKISLVALKENKPRLTYLADHLAVASLSS